MVCANGKAGGADQGCVDLMVFSPSIKQIFVVKWTRNVPHFNPQSKVSRPNNSNVVAGGGFGNLHEENISELKRGKVAVIPTVLLILSLTYVEQKNPQ